MDKKIPIQYYESSSILIHLNPMVKMVWLVLLSVLVLRTSDYRIETLFLVFSLFLFRLSFVKILDLHGSKFVMVTAVFIGIMHLIFTHSGVRVLNLGGFGITNVGIKNAILISTRFLSFVLLGYLFVITTEPNNFVFSLMQIGLPYRIGFSMITALRLIPIFSNEAQSIYSAQVTRGVVYQLKHPKEFFINIYQFLKTLIISMVKKVDALVLAMEGRSFGANQTRTFSRLVEYSLVDKGLLFLAGVIILLQFYVEKESII